MDSKAKDIGLKKFEIENDIMSENQIFDYNDDDYNNQLLKKPWKNDPMYFKRVKISITALIKMVTHAKSGGINEVMGLMQGRFIGDTIIVMDSFALPVEGTETRVNASNDANLYITNYMELAENAGRKENLCGWYHSHPSYGCWLSGIDCTTQELQQHHGPFIAIVIDPIRTVSTGKVEIGAFRCYPQGYKPPQDGKDIGLIPEGDKLQDFGLHAHRYYSLEVSYYKSSLDAKLIDILWNNYWISTLSKQSLTQSFEYSQQKIIDLSKKLPRCMAKAFKYDKVLQTEDLIGKNKGEFKEYIKNSMEKSQTVVTESIKGVLFSGLDG